MSEQSSTVKYTGGTSILGLLGVAFVVLKLTHAIDWSWLWVTAPFWAPLGVVAAIFVVFCLFIIGAFVLAWWESRGKR